MRASEPAEPALSEVEGRNPEPAAAGEGSHSRPPQWIRLGDLERNLNLSHFAGNTNDSSSFFTAIFRNAHLMHSRCCFALETVVVLQYRCPQSGTSYLHTVVAVLRNGSWYKARCGSRQLRPLLLLAAHSFRLAAAPRTIAPPSRPVRAQDASSAGSPPRPCRAGWYPQGPYGNRRPLRRLKRRPAGPIAPCERRLRVPRPPTPESCLILRSAGGWPADRTAFLRITPKRSPLYHAPNRSCT